MKKMKLRKYLSQIINILFNKNKTITYKYFVVKNDGSKKFGEYIKWLNKTYNTILKGTYMGYYYGYDGSAGNGVDFWSTVGEFRNTPIVLTIKEWEDIFINNKPMDKLKKIAEPEKTLAELKKEIEKEKEEQIDVSKFIGRSGTTLKIKGKNKNLISYIKGGLYFTAELDYRFSDNVTVTKTTLNNLVVGDVFILEENTKYMQVSNFEVVVGVKNGNLRTQHISNVSYEYIDNIGRIMDDRVVYKINRY